MSDLVTWLSGVLDTVEATAREAGPRHADSSDLYVQDDDCYYPLVIGPVAVLADVAAKRALIALHGYYLAGGQREAMCTTCGGEGVMSAVEWPCPTLRLLASAYRHCEGFLPEWLPEQLTRHHSVTCTSDVCDPYGCDIADPRVPGGVRR